MRFMNTIENKQTVNNCILRDDSQGIYKITTLHVRCELLSELYFT